MPLIAVTSLTPSALDYVVKSRIPLNRVVFDRNLSTTEDWELGGAYIQQYGIGLYPTASKTDSGQWCTTGWSARGVPDEAEEANYVDGWFEHPHPLVAAMQALVFCVVGLYVDVPDFLVTQP